MAGDFSFQVMGEVWVKCSEHTVEGGTQNSILGERLFPL